MMYRLSPGAKAGCSVDHNNVVLSCPSCLYILIEGVGPVPAGNTALLAIECIPCEYTLYSSRIQSVFNANTECIHKEYKVYTEEIINVYNKNNKCI